MTTADVRGCLRRACEEIEAARDTGGIAAAHEQRLTGIARQLRYHVEGGRADRLDPEAVAYPDPGALDTIGDLLDEVGTEAEGDVAAGVARAREEVRRAVSTLDDGLANQRGRRPGPG